MLSFEWDPEKAASNAKKHGVSFELGSLAFADPHRVIQFDRVKAGEERWHCYGRVDNVVLLVAYTERGDGQDTRIRIISARKANRRERKRKYGR